MLRKLLLSVALVVCVSSPVLADIHQSQDFGLGLSSVVSLLGGSGSASDFKTLTLSLGQTATEPGTGLSAFQGIGAFGQSSLLSTTGITLGGQDSTGSLTQNDAINDAVNSARLSLFNRPPVALPSLSSE